MNDGDKRINIVDSKSTRKMILKSHVENVNNIDIEWIGIQLELMHSQHAYREFNANVYLFRASASLYFNLPSCCKANHQRNFSTPNKIARMKFITFRKLSLLIKNDSIG